MQVPTYPGPLPGGVRPDLTVYLAGLSQESVGMYMQIETPEDPVAFAADTFPTIGAFYDAILAAFQALTPPLSTTGQQAHGLSVPNPGGAGAEPLGAADGAPDARRRRAGDRDSNLAEEARDYGHTIPRAIGGVVVAVAVIYAFLPVVALSAMPVVHGHTALAGQYAGDPVPFPECYPVAQASAAIPTWPSSRSSTRSSARWWPISREPGPAPAPARA